MEHLIYTPCARCEVQVNVTPDTSLLVTYMKALKYSFVVTICHNCEYENRVFCASSEVIFQMLTEGIPCQIERDEVPEFLVSEWVRIHGPKQLTQGGDTMLFTSYRDIVAHLQKCVVGQPRAITQLERSLKIAQTGLRDIDKPLAILFFAGPTGTGKSEMVSALADAIHQDRNYLCRVDCNLLADQYTSNALHGSPPGYVGSSEGHTLLNKEMIEGKPGRPGILVFEEIEKAHPRVFHTLLGIFDKARLKLNNGKDEIDFCNTIIIMTSNIGARELASVAEGKTYGFAAKQEAKANLSGVERKGIVFREMERVFAPEFINRLDDTIVFRWLDKPELIQIVDKLLAEFQQKIDRLNLKLDVSYHAKEAIVEKGYDLRYGARPLKRAIRKYVEDPIAELIADGTHNNVFRVRARGGDVRVESG